VDGAVTTFTSITTTILTAIQISTAGIVETAARAPRIQSLVVGIAETLVESAAWAERVVLEESAEQVVLGELEELVERVVLEESEEQAV